MTRVLIRTYVDVEIRDRFVQKFGGDEKYGLVSYALESTMLEMLEMTEGDPDFVDVVKQAVQIHLRRNKLTQTDPANDSPSD